MKPNFFIFFTFFHLSFFCHFIPCSFIFFQFIFFLFLTFSVIFYHVLFLFLSFFSFCRVLKICVFFLGLNVVTMSLNIPDKKYNFSARLGVRLGGYPFEASSPFFFVPFFSSFSFVLFHFLFFSIKKMFVFICFIFFSSILYQGLTKDVVSSVVGAPWRCGVLTT